MAPTLDLLVLFVIELSKTFQNKQLILQGYFQLENFR